ncbi:hypothetical protein FY034_09420 [Trichlorobacter lovleyi]|uniref:hypothetical protein n=1 Tax=Trichlorobacter lovleyi TaxID=313985 RepID=UPI00223F15E6|nr:hypothetical protein [Trichlorobacter lovleyi]QOX79137.1 hypothetical protein FY034_09420 [Trichlorobacter lovleyi]
MKKDLSLILSILAFILYIVGGLGIFSGLFMVLVLKSKDLFGLGTADTLGYLFLCVGGCLSVAGVLTLRIIRNRTNQKLYQAATC